MDFIKEYDNISDYDIDAIKTNITKCKNHDIKSICFQDNIKLFDLFENIVEKINWTK